MNAPIDRTADRTSDKSIQLTSFSHGGGCGCKIAPAVLSEILASTPVRALPRELLVGIESSDDAAVYKVSDDQAMVATTDFFTPIVDDPYDFGRIAATNALSDVYAMGARPVFALAMVGMPLEKIPVSVIQRVLEGGESVCAKAGIPIAGGHSIDTLEPIYGLVGLGLVHPDKVKRNSSAKKGDVLILGKPLGVGILSAALKKGKLSTQGYQQMLDTATQLNTAGMKLGELEGVHAMTDVTGFGLAGHLLEMCRGAKLGATLRFEDVPVLSEALDWVQQGTATGASGRNWTGYGREVALPERFPVWQRNLLTDPQTSGGLLVACAPEIANEVLWTLHQEGCKSAAAVGFMTDGPPVLTLT